MFADDMCALHWSVSAVIYVWQCIPNVTNVEFTSAHIVETCAEVYFENTMKRDSMLIVERLEDSKLPFGV